MAISYPLTLPTTPGTRSIKIRQSSVVAVGASPYTLEQQVQARQGQCWALDLAYPPGVRATFEPLLAVLAQLNGREGTFLWGDSANKTARGIATGTPLVNGGSQTGYDLVTDGWTASVTGILKAGDWIQLSSGSNARLHKLTADADSDGLGQATLSLWPKISPVAVPADNSAIVVSFPKGVFRLTTDGADWAIDEQHFYGLSVSAMSLP